MKSTDALTVLRGISKQMLQQQTKCDWCDETDAVDFSLDGEQTFLCHSCYDKMQDDYVECSSCYTYDSEGFEPNEGHFICGLCR